MPVTSAVYHELASWLLSLQQIEATTGQPAQLTTAQRKAIQDLHNAIKNPGPPPQAGPSQPQQAGTPEPEVGETNWVGLLHRYRDAYPDEGFKFTEDQALGPTPRFICSVWIKEHSAPFPGPGWGISADGEPPTFTRKKDAKQFAAKCAVEFLRATGRMPPNGEDVKFPKPTIPGAFNPPPSKKLKRKAPPITPPHMTVSGIGVPINPITGAAPSNSNALDMSAVVQVDQLCKKLNLQPPNYQLNQQEIPGFWSGYPEFVPYEAQKYPEGVGQVKDILGKKAAKEAIAEGVLEQLRKINDERQERIQKTLSEMAGKGPQPAM